MEKEVNEILTQLNSSPHDYYLIVYKDEFGDIKVEWNQSFSTHSKEWIESGIRGEIDFGEEIIFEAWKHSTLGAKRDYWL